MLSHVLHILGYVALGGVALVGLVVLLLIGGLVTAESRGENPFR